MGNEVQEGSGRSLQALRAYLSRHEPTMAEEMAGADQQRIARLEELAGQTLPASYREFLQLCGAEPGDWLSRGESDWNLRIENAIELYENGEVARRREQLVIGSGAHSYGFVLVLAQERGGVGSPLVWEIDFGLLPGPDDAPPWGVPLSSSFEALLWGAALRLVRMPALAGGMRSCMPVASVELLREERIERVHHLARSLSLVPLYGDDGWSAGYDSDDLALTLYAPPPCNPVVTLAASDAHQLKQVVDRLCFAAGMIPAPF